jgi:hypothetical protein
VVYQERLKFDPILCCLGGCTSSPGKGGAAPLGVRVLHEQTVGGFDVNVLEADDAEELSQWIKKHGFSDDPELYEWLKPYVANKWKITAFRISRDPKSGGLATTKAVRMSFETDRPFFPYREPEVKEKKDQPKNAFKPRLLRVLFVSNERMDGTRGNSAWHAQVKWSDEISDAQRRQLARDTGLKDDDLPAKAWLTSFEDSASPRPGTEEVYFESAKDQTPIRPQVIQYNDVWIPLDVVILGVIVLFVVVSAAFVMWKKRA